MESIINNILSGKMLDAKQEIQEELFSRLAERIEEKSKEVSSEIFDDEKKKKLKKKREADIKNKAAVLSKLEAEDGGGF